jgi:hypothetical protein
VPSSSESGGCDTFGVVCGRGGSNPPAIVVVEPGGVVLEGDVVRGREGPVARVVVEAPPIDVVVLAVGAVVAPDRTLPLPPHPVISAIAARSPTRCAIRGIARP